MFSDYITWPVCSQMLYIQQPFGIKESACLFMGRSFENERVIYCLVAIHFLYLLSYG